MKWKENQDREKNEEIPYEKKNMWGENNGGALKKEKKERKNETDLYIYEACGDLLSSPDDVAMMLRKAVAFVAATMTMSSYIGALLVNSCAAHKIVHGGKNG